MWHSNVAPVTTIISSLSAPASLGSVAIQTRQSVCHARSLIHQDTSARPSTPSPLKEISSRARGLVEGYELGRRILVPSFLGVIRYLEARLKLA
jgi:hypothetical protein